MKNVTLIIGFWWVASATIAYSQSVTTSSPATITIPTLSTSTEFPKHFPDPVAKDSDITPERCVVHNAVWGEPLSIWQVIKVEVAIFGALSALMFVGLIVLVRNYFRTQSTRSLRPTVLFSLGALCLAAVPPLTTFTLSAAAKLFCVSLFQGEHAMGILLLFCVSWIVLAVASLIVWLITIYRKIAAHKP